MSDESKGAWRLQPLVSLGASLKGICLAPEARAMVVWGDELLAIVSLDGSVRQAVDVPGPGEIVAAACDVGAEAVYVVHSRHGLARLKGRNLEYEWDRRVERPLCLQATPFGEYVVTGTADSALLVFDCYGRRVARSRTVRPPHQVALAAGTDAVFVAGDITMLARYDIRLREVWEERVMTPMGPLATPGLGMYLLVCTFGYGLERYHGDGSYEGSYQVRNGVRLVDVDFDGAVIAAVSMDNHLVLLDAVGVVRQDRPLACEPPAQLRLTPSGDRAYMVAKDAVYCVCLE